MGSAALMAYSLARACPIRSACAGPDRRRRTDDGLGGLATIAVQPAPNLSTVVLDNGHFGETGMQPSHTGLGFDLAAVAHAAGFAETATIDTMAGVETLRTQLRDTGCGPRLHVIRVASEPLPRSLPPRDAVVLKNRFRTALNLPGS